MNVTMVSYEVDPFAKVGGLADVVGTLPKFLKKIVDKINVIMPFHKVVEENIKKYNLPLEKVAEDLYPISHSFKYPFSVYKSHLPDTDIPIYFIKNENLFSTKDIYEYPNKEHQTSYFSDCVLSFIKNYLSDTEIIHINDWQTSLISVYLKNNYRDDPILSKTSTILTIHNLGYQGIFPPEILNISGLPGYLYNIDALEFFGQINFLKGGILFSDIINTVSKTYAEEIQTEEYGYKLDGVLKVRNDDLYGILNGIDYNIFNPETDKSIPYNFNKDKLENKNKNKVYLQEKLGLPKNENVPILSFIGRIVEQKGIDLISEILDYLTLLDVQIIILGTGEKRYEDLLSKYQNKYPKKLSINIKFDKDLAQLIYAGSDIFIMPSKYEPCGLGQMYAMRYGTIPIVRYTGGLADTVREFSCETLSGTGFGFYEYSSSNLLIKILKSIHLYNREKNCWKKLITNAMNEDFSWNKSADEYHYIYKRALSKKRF
ncbi:glycogen synthase (ADP-glucose) [Marinitoga hydrogenitolerans DSM 16785]|uniref:Glycogen synthase n=1 Tax=Marinitoga hydrogenitolerans (strain DSM 16785 / JCM 12826 / AT1271) TaxID=1122195 RepID=A0A1M4UHN2_MARH1|nr:glycogen synthase [Marinitoga hydrogenitolerans]SHE56271.1 glycogen synthase (ADP-glucose) [Marinitoga hydrogenitolerans DSM 16785]